MNRFSLQQVNRLLLYKQHLADDSRVNDIVRIAADISGLHAIGIQEPYIALFVRTRDFSREQLDTELYQKRTFAKIRCMRGTLYILPKAQIPIAFSATKALVEKLSVGFLEFRGVSPGKYERISQLVLKVLRGREMTMAQIKRELGIALTLSALLNLMCDRGLLVRIQSAKDWRSRNYRYALFAEYLPDVDLTAFNEAEAMDLLVKQYLSSFGPGMEEDIVWWIGITKAKVRQVLSNIAGEMTQIQINGLEGDFLILRSDLELIKNLKTNSKYVVNLLPNLDPYLMGYKKRTRYLNNEHYDRIFDRGRNVTSTILVNGRISGVWDFSRDDVQAMKLHLFEKVDDDMLQLISLKAKQLGKFLSGKNITINMIPNMASLIERTAGGFMSPLREK